MKELMKWRGEIVRTKVGLFGVVHLDVEIPETGSISFQEFIEAGRLFPEQAVEMAVFKLWFEWRKFKKDLQNLYTESL